MLARGLWAPFGPSSDLPPHDEVEVLVDTTITECYGKCRIDQNPGRESDMLPAPLPLDYLKHADPSDRFRRSRIRSGGSRVRRDPREHGREVMPA